MYVTVIIKVKDTNLRLGENKEGGMRMENVMQFYFN